MADSDRSRSSVALAQLQPSVLLEAAPPLLIDEWQAAPSLWDAVRLEVDERQATGQFILTGSAVPADRSKIFHTGTGRIARLRMRPMSLCESGDSSGGVSLGPLFEGCFSACRSKLGYEDVAFLVCRGGWPATLDQTPVEALTRSRECFEAVVSGERLRADGVKRRPEWFKRLMRVCSLHQGAPLSLASLSKALQADGQYVSTKTLSDYLEALAGAFVTEDVPAWRPKLRTKTAIRTTSVRAFSDPSFCAVALELKPEELMRRPDVFASAFKALCLRDLRVYGDLLDGMVYHYRDKNDLECDAVLHRRNGTYGLIEIKLGGEEAIEHGAKTLKALAGKIDETRMEKPAFLMVLTAVGDFAYQREDGVFVVPVGCLKY